MQNYRRERGYLCVFISGVRSNNKFYGRTRIQRIYGIITRSTTALLPARVLLSRNFGAVQRRVIWRNPYSRRRRRRNPASVTVCTGLNRVCLFPPLAGAIMLWRTRARSRTLASLHKGLFYSY